MSSCMGWAARYTELRLSLNFSTSLLRDSFVSCEMISMFGACPVLSYSIMFPLFLMSISSSSKSASILYLLSSITNLLARGPCSLSASRTNWFSSSLTLVSSTLIFAIVSLICWSFDSLSLISWERACNSISNMQISSGLFLVPVTIVGSYPFCSEYCIRAAV